MKLKLYIYLAIALLVSACGEYEKLLKSTDYDLKKAKAKEYYDAGQYVKTTELLGQILPRYRASADAEDLAWMNAMSFYNMKDYYMASNYFKQFIEQFPFGEHAEEANYMAAYCDYKIAPRPELDQDNTRSAIEGFRIYITRYPESPRAEEAKKLISELEDKLVEKSYLSAKLYYDMKQYRAAITALNNSLKDFSNSKYREEMMFLKLNSHFLYAENSLPARQRERYQEALDDYFSFVEEFPESAYKKEIADIYEKTNRYLKANTPAGALQDEQIGENKQ